jgi:hypothetical protein
MIGMGGLGRSAAFCFAVGLSLSITACGGGGGGNTTPPPPTTYTLTVASANPASGVAITVSPADNNSASNGTTSFTRTYNSGTSVTLTAPATSGGNSFLSWTGCTSSSTVTCTVAMSGNTTVTAGYTNSPIITPTVTVTPSAFSITALQPLTVTVAVSGGAGNPTATGSVVLTSGSYTSAAANLSGGSAQIIVPAGTLATGGHTLKATYTPDAASSAAYNSASGTSATVTVIAVSTVTVTMPGTPLVVTDQILGMNMAVWYNVVANKTAIVNAFKTAGIKSVRWPGGSASDTYHWATNTECLGGYTDANDTFANFVSDLAIPASLDVALTADYGTNAACTGGGDPAEAAAWVAAALALPTPITVSHMTVGNESYGSWEEDLHTAKNDAATYAAAVAGAGGYYSLIKAASANTQVGVVVNPGNTPAWDPTVLTNAKGSYDFVEFHYYPEAPGSESDTFLVQQAAQGLTTNINTIKSELTTAGRPNTPIYVGEIGGPYSNPGKQSWSITQGLYAGQVLGELMNDGVSRLTWWIGFGNCNGDNGNNLASLYGWQNFGGYNVFADGAGDTGGIDNSPCNYGGPIGTMSPTARAFQLFSNVAVNGEHVLTPVVVGDTTDVRAYAATHGGGAALVLFNLNETTSEAAEISISGQATANSVTVITYDKAIYDLSGSPTGNPPDPAGTSTWAGPTTTTLGAQSLPLTLTLTPWSMNVVLIQ